MGDALGEPRLLGGAGDRRRRGSLGRAVRRRDPGRLGAAQRDGDVSLEDGAIVGRTAAGSPNSFLTTTREFADFELEFEIKVDDSLNSGVQIRSRTSERDTGQGADEQTGRVFGPQVEIEASPGLAGYV